MIDRYSRPELTAIWSDDARFALWLEIELAVCEAMESRGRVPAGSAAAAASSEMNSIFCRSRRRMTVSSWSSPIAIAFGWSVSR